MRYPLDIDYVIHLLNNWGLKYKVKALIEVFNLTVIQGLKNCLALGFDSSLGQKIQTANLIPSS